MTDKDLERKSFRLVLKSGFIKGILYFLFVVLVWHDKPLITVARGFFIGMGVALAIEYLWYYQRNIKYHYILKKRLGDVYLKDLDIAVKEIGLRKMLQQWWFVTRYKQVWDI